MPIAPQARRLRLLLPLLVLLLGGSGDPGVLLELDRQTFALTSRDLRADAAGPRFPVVLGSPAHPTPSGAFPVYQVVRNPGWKPGDTASRYGARPIAPSPRGPLGAARIRFGGEGVALHGGADPLLLGKPVSLGCVRARDADLLALLDWLDAQGALGRRRPQADGEIHQSFRRTVRLVVR